METSEKVRFIGLILKKRRSARRIVLNQQILKDSRDVLTGGVSEAEAEKIRSKYRETMTPEELAADDAIPHVTTSHGVVMDYKEVSFSLLGGTATAVDTNGGDEESRDREFYISFDPRVKDRLAAEDSPKATLLKIRFPYSLSNKEVQRRLEEAASDIKKSMDDGESLQGATLLATMKHGKRFDYSKEYDLLNEDVSTVFLDRVMSDVYASKSSQNEAFVILHSRDFSTGFDGIRERFEEERYAAKEALRQIQAIRIIKRIAKKEGWKLPKAIDKRKAELEALIPVIKENEKIKKAQRDEARLKKRTEEQLAKSTPIENTSVAYGQSALAQSLSAYRQTLTGHLNEENVQFAGRMVFGALKDRLTERAKFFAKQDEEQPEKYKIAHDKYVKALAAYKGCAGLPRKVQKELYEAFQAAASEMKKVSSEQIAADRMNESVAMMREFLSSIRPLCSLTDEQIGEAIFKNPNADDLACLSNAMRHYPKEFLEGIIKNHGKKIEIIGENLRGYWNGNEICVHGDMDTALHELGHAFENNCPIILALEQQFYSRRTKGCELEKLRDILNLPYDDHEVARKDNFIHPYMGKDYEGTAYELVSMGFEMFFTRPHELLKDPDYFKFIAGIITMVTP